MSRKAEVEEKNIPLLLDYSSSNYQIKVLEEEEEGLWRKTWIESKKLWHVVGPAIFSRIATYSLFLCAQAFAGHLGDLEFAAMSIACNVVLGFDFGLMLGMASALETLCGQAYGAKKYYMLGVYLQRSWVVLSLCCLVTLPIYIFATPLLKLIGQPQDIAELTGVLVLYLIPIHFGFAFNFPLQRFLQSQLKNAVIAYVSFVALGVCIFVSWLVVYKFEFGAIGAALAMTFSWYVNFLGLLAYTVFGGCPQTWSGFSMQAFSGLWEFLKLSASSGVMLCLENWYYKILILVCGNLKNVTVAIDAVSICMNVNGWLMMIPLAFFAGTGVRVANELGAGNGKAARFASIVSVVQSTLIGLVLYVAITLYHDQIAHVFSTSQPVLEAVNDMAILLAFTVLLNSVQPILSGVAVGSGWQGYVAYINVFCYYLIGVPLGILMGWVFNQGVKGIWAGMIFGGTATQTVILAIITVRCDWEKEVEKANVRLNKWGELAHSSVES